MAKPVTCSQASDDGTDSAAVLFRAKACSPLGVATSIFHSIHEPIPLFLEGFVARPPATMRAHVRGLLGLLVLLREVDTAAKPADGMCSI